MTVLPYRPRSPDEGPDSDRSLIRRVARGDRAAFETLYRRYHPRLHRYLLRIVAREDLVEETLNDTMFAVWTGAARFRQRSKLSTWIFGIAYRQGMKALARARRADDRGLTDALGSEPPSEPRQRDLELSVEQALRRLSPEHRAVIELTYFHGYSYPEIARIVGCPVNTVKTRTFHARRKLERVLQAGRRRSPEVEAATS